MKVADYYVIPVADLDKYRKHPTKQRVIDAAVEERLNGNEVVIVKVLNEKNKENKNVA